MSIKASAPGSLMLLGEYAVLQNHVSLVCAVNQRVTVCLDVRADQCLRILSPLGTLEIAMNELTQQKPFQFVLAVFQRYRAQLVTGFTVTIHSDMSHQMGLGSSAAVTVATVKALRRYLKQSDESLAVLQEAREVIRAVQGRGSGADVAASVYGGLVAYRADPLSVEWIEHVYPLTVCYSGSKTPTPQAIQQVQHYFESIPRVYDAILSAIGECAEQGVAAARVADWQGLGKMMTLQQGLMEALNVSNDALRQRIDVLRAEPAMLGCKISGAGLGDCVVGLGRAYTPAVQALSPLEIEITLQGVCDE